MSKKFNKKDLILNDDLKTLDICEIVSHNKTLSKQRLIELVKLLARQAAEEDYAQSIIHPQSRKQ